MKLFKNNIKTYGDLVKLIEKNNLENEKIILGVEGYNTLLCVDGDIKNAPIVLQEINGHIILSDNCGSYFEDFR